jgi:predicted ester cyclase
MGSAGGTQLPPTGIRVQLKGMVTTLTDGTIAEHRMYWDKVEAAQQAGLLRAPRTCEP